MNIEDTKYQITELVLKNLTFEKFNDISIIDICKANGINPQVVKIVFPNISKDIFKYYIMGLVNKTIVSIKEEEFVKLKIREKIFLLLKSFFEDFANQTLIFKKMVLFSMANPILNTEVTIYLADAFWKKVGDKSTDYNYYTKRGILSVIYNSMLNYMINDTSEHYQQSFEFLNRRINDVMQIEKFKKSIKLPI